MSRGTWGPGSLVKLCRKPPRGPMFLTVTIKKLIQKYFFYIDFVIVYEEVHTKKPKLARHLSVAEQAEKRRKRDLAEMQQKWRSRYLRNLQRRGVEIKKVVHIFCN